MTGKYIFFILAILATSLFFSFSTTNTSAQNEINQMDLLITVGKNGNATVAINLTTFSGHAINFTIPKTAINIDFSTEQNFTKIDSSWCSSYLEIIAYDAAKISFSFDWPDCVVPYNGSYYFSGNEYIGLYPNLLDIDSYVTIILPPDSQLLSTPSPFENTTRNGQIWLTNLFQKRANIDVMYVYSFKYSNPNYSERRENATSNDITLEYPTELKEITADVLPKIQDTYDLLSSFKTRDSNKLLIKVVPDGYIRERESFANAFYTRDEDAIYIDTIDFFAWFYRYLPTYTLYHEMTHAFTIFSEYPTFLNEGISEYQALKLFNDTHERGFYNEMAKRPENPLENKYFNAYKFFNWSTHYPDIDYNEAFYIAFKIANLTNANVFENLTNKLREDNFNFYSVSEQTDRYDLLLYYMKQLTGEDLTQYFYDLGLNTDITGFTIIQTNILFAGFFTIPLIAFGLFRAFRGQGFLKGVWIGLTGSAVFLAILCFSKIYQPPAQLVTQNTDAYFVILLIVYVASLFFSIFKSGKLNNAVEKK